MNAVCASCTTRRHNAHITEQRDLLYPWHPWSGRRVFVHETIDKGGVDVYRCSLSGLAADRWLEVPVWMFERAASANWRIGDAPQADITTLGALALLLEEAVRFQHGRPQSLESGAALLSHHPDEGDDDAAQAEVLSVRSVRKPRKRRGGKGAALAEVAGANAPDAHDADDTPDPQPRRAKRRRHSNGGGAS